MNRSAIPFILVILASLIVSACTPGPGTVEPTATSTPIGIASVPTPTITVPPASPTSTTSPTPETPTPTVTPTPCGPPPSGWVLYTVRAGDTLFGLAAQVGLNQETVMQANCFVTPELLIGQVLYLPFNPCTPAPLPGWTLYTVRSGDTLFSLATTRGTTVDEVMRANCLNSTNIAVGQGLFLPQLILPPPPPSPQVPPCPSVLSCPSTALPPLMLAPGGGNDPTFKPCSPSDSNRIQTSSLVIELGERLYFFACNFPSPPVSAAVILSNGSIQPLALLDPLTVNRDLITSTIINTSTGDVEYKAQAVIEWAAVPTDASTQPIGIHTLIITDGSGNKEERQFMVKLPTKKHILVLPHADAPGRTFQVYFVNFDLNTDATFELYGEDQPSSVRGKHTLTHRGQWTIPITKSLPQSSDKGWAQAPLVSASTDLRVAYSISYNQNEIYTLFWLK